MELTRKQIILNCEKLERRFALLAGGKLEEYIAERENDDVKLGSIYLGKIVNLEPSLQAAFVDIGAEKNAFLHYSDIIDGSDDVIERQDDLIKVKNRENNTKRSEKLEEITAAAKNRKKRKFTVNNIPEYFRPGTELLVQVVKGPIGTKGARVSTNLSIAGRYLVILPYSAHIGLSTKIEDKTERERLKKILNDLEVPEGVGLICRTVGEGRKAVFFKRDLKILLDYWDSIEDKISRCEAPVCVYQEPDLILRTARDFMTEEIGGIVVDDKNAYSVIHSMLRKHGGLRMGAKVKHYTGKDPIYEYYNIDNQLSQLLRREVALPSGGYICIDETEALIAIDVNSGRVGGKKKIEHPELIFRTNMEAAEEIARQLRLRNVGGLVVIDFIDMRTQKDREEIYKAMKKFVKEDRAKTKVLPISKFGLMEMTRQRELESLASTIFDPCPYCRGTGHVMSAESMSVAIQRRLTELLKNSKYKKVPFRLIMHPDILARLKNEDSHLLSDIEAKYHHDLTFRADPSMHCEEFKIVDAETLQELE
ncbi:MAG: Rne/Rng family ribonuclease [Lentisphaeria bacterium]|nr:Rne/Rng family ribonuclease [Lentisphaeria bacterium]